MDSVQIIILAAGKSRRMQSDNPKALALFKGKPFIEHILETIERVGVPTKPVIVVGHMQEKIKELLGADHVYAEQNEQLGTGHAVQSAKNATHPEHKIVLVVSTDQPTLSAETIKNIINHHKNTKAVITMGTVVVPDFNDWRKAMYHFGRVIRDADRSVKKIVEFKDATEEEKLIKELNLALYAFDTDWLWKNITKLKNGNAQGEYYLTDLVTLACEQQKKIEAVPVKNLIEGLHPNSQEELKMLESLVV